MRLRCHLHVVSPYILCSWEVDVLATPDFLQTTHKKWESKGGSAHEAKPVPAMTRNDCPAILSFDGSYRPDREARIQGLGRPKRLIRGWTPVMMLAPPASDAETIAYTLGLTGRFSGSDIPGIKPFIHRLMAGCKF